MNEKKKQNKKNDRKGLFDCHDVSLRNILLYFPSHFSDDGDNGSYSIIFMISICMTAHSGKETNGEWVNGTDDDEQYRRRQK